MPCNAGLSNSTDEMAISDMNEASGHEHGTDKNDTLENDALENIQKSVVKEVPVPEGEKGMWLKLTKHITTPSYGNDSFEHF